MWGTILGGVLGPVVTAVSDYFKHQQEITKIERQGDIELKKAKLEGAIKHAADAQQNEANWDLAQVNNSGWKDEYLTIVLSIPLIGCFIPGLSPYVLQGFVVLETTPVWFQAAVGVMIAAAFGMKSYAKYLDIKSAATGTPAAS